MRGPISFRARVTLPPGKQRFLQKVRLEGDFGIGGGHFTNPKTQYGVDKLSERARGEKNDEDPERVISNLKGHVVLRNGVATFSYLSFNVPGAFAELRGTYNLINKRVDLRGKMRMDATLSQASKGIKSFFVKALDPFYKKKNAGAIVPVSITGTYSQPSYGIALTARR